MNSRHHRRIPGFALFCLLILFSSPAFAQLNTVFSTIFTDILEQKLKLSPGLHGNHFVPVAVTANNELVPALNGLIAGDISSFPLSSTSAGVVFDFSTGQPVRVTESLGPILAETAKPLGKGKFLVEANFTYLDLARYRGLATDQMQFTFTHQDVTDPSGGTSPILGQSPNESDIIDLVMDLHTHVSIWALFATYGVTNKLDVSVAIPFINARIFGTARATIQSYTFAEAGGANHIFGGTPQNPVLVTDEPYDRSATGIGDIALRLKYNFESGGDVDFASLLDVRFPTGKKENFLGSGKPTYRLWGILSAKMGDMTPHLNFGYAAKPAKYQSDAIEFRAGLDDKLSSQFTLAVDILGQIDVNSNEAIHLFPGTREIADHIETVRDGAGTDLVPGVESIRNVKLSNIPDQNNDNAFSAAVGLRYAPSETFIIFGNVLVPMNAGGLRAAVAPTIGFSVVL
jgi:hypothetical protein